MDSFEKRANQVDILEIIRSRQPELLQYVLFGFGFLVIVIIASLFATLRDGMVTSRFAGPDRSASKTAYKTAGRDRAREFRKHAIL